MSKYCVIGAGPAGLASMKTLVDAGLEFDCFERTQAVGGHWNTDYEALHLITSSKVTGYEGHPMPEDWPIFPSRKLMLKYFEDFADEFDLRKYVTFGVSVDRVEPLPTDGPTGSAGWNVTTSDGKTNTYDGVFVANGHLWDEKRPEFPGEFTGKTIHSGSYTNTKDIDGTRVLVIGSGNSGCDLAVDAAQNHFETDIVIRRGHFFQPKTFFWCAPCRTRLDAGIHIRGARSDRSINDSIVGWYSRELSRYAGSRSPHFGGWPSCCKSTTALLDSSRPYFG
jgi:cation diffusion facilitator CzcD-associated flavoprotein CzcO